MTVEQLELNDEKPRGHFARALSRLFRKKIAVFSLIIINLDLKINL